MVDFYQRHISAWMDGTEGLEDGEYRAYDVICNLIYLKGGPIVQHESGIAGRCNQHPLKFRRNLEKLIEKNKIVVLEGGKITNLRVEAELKKITDRRRTKEGDHGPTPAQPPRGRSGVQRGSAVGGADKPLKNIDPTLFGDAVEKRIEDSVAKATAPGKSVAMQNPPPDPEADLFRRGREILGATAGGMIKKLLIAKGGNVALARAALEQASQRGDAKEYVGAMIRMNGAPAARTGNGFAALLRESQEQEMMGGFDGGYENGSGDGSDARLIPDRTGSRH